MIPCLPQRTVPAPNDPDAARERRPHNDQGPLGSLKAGRGAHVSSTFFAFLRSALRFENPPRTESHGKGGPNYSGDSPSPLGFYLHPFNLVHLHHIGVFEGIGLGLTDLGVRISTLI